MPHEHMADEPLSKAHSSKLKAHGPRLSGILNVDKPQGWTSHDVVTRIRRITGQREVGHAGTLDPLATGVLIVALGNGTKLSNYLMRSPKTYCAEVVLGASTVTDDAEAPANRLIDPGPVSRADLEDCVRTFVGDILQVPPKYAAIKRDGKKLYQLARQGKTIEVEPRRVTIHSIEIEGFELPRVQVRVHCAPGTYIRSLARDIGSELGVGGYLHALRRVQSGRFQVDDAFALDGLDREAVERKLVPIDGAVTDLPALLLSESEEKWIRQGQRITAGGQYTGNVRLYGPSGDLAALARIVAGEAQPFKVFAPGDPSDAKSR